MAAATETSTLLIKETAGGDGAQHRSNNKTILLAAAGIAIIISGLLIIFAAGVSFSARQSRSTSPAKPDPTLLPSSSSRLAELAAKKKNECVSMCVGVYDSTCMIVGGNAFPFPEGILSGLVLGVPSSDGEGIDYYLLSVDNDYLGPLYLEHGHYTLDEGSSALTMIPNATKNCKGGNDLYYRFREDENWSPLHLDMEWNSIDGGKGSFSLGTNDGFGCYYAKLSGDRCREVYHDIVRKFADVADVELDVPNVDQLCADD